MNKFVNIKKTNRWISVVAAGTVLISALPMNVFAEETTSTTSTTGAVAQTTASSFETSMKSATTSTTTTTSATTTSSSKEKTSAQNTKAESVETWMPDANLRKAVAAQLSTDTGKINPEDITKELMSNLSELNFALYTLNIPVGTVVDFTGLEYAGEFLNFDSSTIVATNVPDIRVAVGGVVSALPNVLPHIKVNGRLKELSIGRRYLEGVPAAELLTASADINRLNPTDYLGIFSSDMTDFSSLGINTDTTSGVFSSSNYNYLTPLELPQLTIIEGQEGKVTYSQDIVKAVDGSSLFSKKVFVNNPLRAFFYDKDMNTVSVADDSWELTDEGISFNQVPTNVSYIQFDYSPSPMRSIANSSYLLQVRIPVVRATIAKDVTVKYLNEDDQEVRAAKTIGGFVGGDYDATDPEYKFDTIDGYELDTTKLPSNTVGKLSGQAQEVIYRYKKRDAAAVTVQYLDENNQELRADQTIKGKVGDTYDATTAEYKLSTIDDYVLDESKLPTNAKGNLDDTAKKVVYSYKKKAVPATSKVTVKYIDEAEKEIRDAKVISGTVSEDYDVTTAEYKLAKIDGYVLDESKLPTNGKGTFATTDQTVVYRYKKAATAATSKVVVKYVDEDEKEIREAKVVEGVVGDKYDVTTADYKLAKIDGYQLNEDKLPNNGEGLFNQKDQVVTYVYKKVGTTTGTTSGYSRYSRGSILTSGRSNQKSLPKTGENTLAANILVVVGMAMIVSALMIFVRKRKV